MDNLRFRRQFLLSPHHCEQFKDWKSGTLGIYTIYVHPDCELTISGSLEMDVALIGYIIDPDDPDKSNANILDDIAASNTIEGVCEKLYNYGGRFVLLVKQLEEYIIFHDACGLKSVVYTKFDNDIYVASQPLLFKFLIPLKEGDKYRSYHDSAVVKNTVEHWIPSGSTLYNSVFHLVPNHYLKFSTFEQIRYWPDKEISRMPFEEGLKKASSLLSKIMIAANHRFKLALPLTGGFDSRILLSACKPMANDVYFYTLQYRDLTSSSNDIRIPRDVLNTLGYTHHVIDCRKPPHKDFVEIYLENTDIPHLFDWGVIANAMLKEFPQDRIALKGSCSEIARCEYYKKGKHKNISSVEDLFSELTYYNYSFFDHWKDIPFVKDKISEWFNELNDSRVNMGYDILDFFYWEQRIGSWQAQSQLEWDIAQEAFTPFNNRALLSINLAVDAQYRSKPDYTFFKALIKDLWKETLVAPFNPKPWTKKVKDDLKGVVQKLGLFSILKKMMKRKK